MISDRDKFVRRLTMNLVLPHGSAHEYVATGEVFDTAGLDLPASGFFTRLFDERDASAHQLECGPLECVLGPHLLFSDLRPSQMDGKFAEDRFNDPLKGTFAVSSTANPYRPDVFHVFTDQAVTAESKHVGDPFLIWRLTVFIADFPHELVKDRRCHFGIRHDVYAFGDEVTVLHSSDLSCANIHNLSIGQPKQVAVLVEYPSIVNRRKQRLDLFQYGGPELVRFKLGSIVACWVVRLRQVPAKMITTFSDIAQKEAIPRI